MKRIILYFAFVLVSVVSVAAQADKLEWSDTTRDVLIDGEVDRNLQLLTSSTPSRLALISPKFDKAIVLDIDGKTVNTMSKEAFQIASDKTSATTDRKTELKPIGKFTRVDVGSFVYSFAVDGKLIVIRNHPGLTGEITEENVWATVPAWRMAMQNHAPDARAVAAIKAIEKDTNITILFGTWCGDSKYYVPRLLKALHEANNPKLKVKLIGIDNQFNQPIDVVQPRRLVNVPTVIVERDGHEIGRYVETPATNSIEEDIAAILQEKPLTHSGRWDRTAKVASGAYSYRDPLGKEFGKETWELFNTAEGGYLLHSHIVTGDVTTEIFHQLNAKKQTTFMEVTRTTAANVIRTRYHLDDQQLTATVRGGAAGTVKQTLQIPAQLAVSSSSVAAEGWVAGHQGQVASYFVPREFASTAGTLSSITNQSGSDEKVKVPAGEYQAHQVIRLNGKEHSEWWLHPQLNIPVRGRLADGTEFVLTSLDFMAKNEKAL